MAYLLAHWKDILLAIMGVDMALIPLFPQSGLLLKIKDVLANLSK